MKKLATVVLALLLTASLSFAQDTGGDKTKSGPTKTATAATGKKATKSKKSHHKGGKKGKKSTTDSTTPPPK